MPSQPLIEVSDTEVAVPCQNCEFPVRVEHAKVELLNAGSFSMLVWAHKIFECAHCGYKIVGQIAGFNPAGLTFTWIAVPPKKEESAITKPPTSLII